jgi:hypothetical protein
MNRFLAESINPVSGAGWIFFDYPCRGTTCMQPIAKLQATSLRCINKNQ